MDLQQFIAIILGGCTLVGMIWSVFRIKDELEHDLSNKVDNLKEIITQQDKAITVLQSQLDSNNRATNERITNLHDRSKSKIQDLTFANNAIQEWLQKASNNPNLKFVIRQRDKETIDNEGESWTGFM